jgi:hypothetical protein
MAPSQQKFAPKKTEAEVLGRFLPGLGFVLGIFDFCFVRGY